MRIALTTALMMAAALVWAEEPNAPAPAAEAEASKTEAVAAPADKPAAPPTAAEAAADATVAKAQEEEREFKPPPGYRPKRVNGEQVYCSKVVVLGSRFAKEDCRTEAQLRELADRREEMRGDMEQRSRVCAGGGACQSF
jgi:hypothetical protein